MSASKRALLVGINAYPDNPLQGCVNDVLIVKDLLVQKGYRSEEIKLIQDGAATRKAILDGLGWLQEGAREGDRRLFHYSGHGSRVHDQSGDEEDGWDETLVPVDYAATGQMVLDDDLRKEYARMTRNKVKLLLVMDSCHSGTSNRDPAVSFRNMPPKRPIFERNRARKQAAAAKAKKELTSDAIVLAKIRELAKSGKPFHEIARMVPALIEIEDRRYDKKNYTRETVRTTGILIAGCQDNQLSQEREFEVDGGGKRRHGALTHFLLKALRSGILAYEKLVKQTTTWMIDETIQQAPRLECSKENRGANFLGFE